MGADSGSGTAGEVHQHHLRAGQIICTAQKLLYKLRSPLTYAHGADGAVAGVAVAAEDHTSAAGHHLTGVLVDDRLIGRDIDAAVFFRSTKTEHMVVLVYGAAHSAQTVVAVGHHIGQRELIQPRCLRRLDDAHIGDVVGNQAVEFKLQGAAVSGGVMGKHHACCHCLQCPGLPAAPCQLLYRFSLMPENAALMQSNHITISSLPPFCPIYRLQYSTAFPHVQ